MSPEEVIRAVLVAAKLSGRKADALAEGVADAMGEASEVSHRDGLVVTG